MEAFLGAGLRLGPDYSLPRIKNNYKGDTVTPRILSGDAVTAMTASEDLKASSSPQDDGLLPPVQPPSFAEDTPTATSLPLAPPPVPPEQHLPPPERRGWLKKEARKSFLKNWKNRYFVLDQGLLTYFENSATSPPYGHNERGKSRLLGARVEQKGSTNLLIRFEKGEDRDLLVQAADARDCTEWLQALQSHIRFVNSS
jgi:hypothetical protein